MTRLGAVLYPEYREFERVRARTNDTIQSMHVANELALDLLRSQPDKSVLTEVAFSATRDIGRVNVSLAALIGLLEKSERDFAYMALPFLLSRYHEFLKSLESLWISRVPTSSSPEASEFESAAGDLEGAHRRFADLTGVQLPEDLLSTFDLARRVRNRIVHFGGTSGSNLRPDMKRELRPAAEQWEIWAGHKLRVGGSREQIDLDASDVVVLLALTTKLARLACAGLATKLPKETWADIAVSDFRTQSPRLFGDPNQRLRAATNFARLFYKAVGLDEKLMDAAIRRKVVALAS